MSSYTTEEWARMRSGGVLAPKPALSTNEEQTTALIAAHMLAQPHASKWLVDEALAGVVPPVWDAIEAVFAPRVVSTVAELDALPGSSVIRDSFGRVYKKAFPGDGTSWSGTGGDDDFLSPSSLKLVEFPATVLWVGGIE